MISLIPARGGSKRIPEKNIADLGGYPLIGWTITLCLQIGFDTYVSTDDPKIAIIAREWGAQVIPRPDAISGDTAGDRDVICHFNETTGPWTAPIAYMRPTTPFRTQSSVLGALRAFEEVADQIDSLRSVEEMAESAFKCFRIEQADILVPLMACTLDDTGRPNQQCEKTYKGNGVIDIVKPEIIAAGGLWGDRCIAWKTAPTIEIDTPLELEIARYWAATRKGDCFESFRQA